MKRFNHEGLKRREKTLKVIKNLGVDYCEGLPLIGEERLCKTQEQVCKRFLACFFCAMLACDYGSDRESFEKEGRKTICSFLEQFNVKSELYPDELKIITGDCDERLAVNVSWTLECCYALMWALGFISTEEMEEPSNMCDTRVLVKLVQHSSRPLMSLWQLAKCTLSQKSWTCSIYTTISSGPAMIKG